MVSREVRTDVIEPNSLPNRNARHYSSDRGDWVLLALTRFINLSKSWNDLIFDLMLPVQQESIARPKIPEIVSLLPL